MFDLRPLRPLLASGRLGDVSERMAQVIFGFDAFVILGGSDPSEML